MIRAGTGVAALATLFAALAASQAGLASGGTITFTGAITENTCTIRVQGADSSDGTVVLPVVDASALDDTSQLGGAAAGTFFSITLSDCALDDADASGNATNQVAVYFEAGPNVDPETHALINTGSSNVVVKLYEAADASLIGRQINPGVPGEVVLRTDGGTWDFYAVYARAADGAVTTGTVSTAVTYSLVYQ
jgi:major type 1 subunit fimbrin (pilin)